MEILNFDQMGLNPNILRAINDLGFEAPSPIQSSSIPVIKEGKDIIGQAQTGTGKTAAFAISTIEMIKPRVSSQVLIMTPTRELAIQVSEEYRKFCKYMDGVRTLPIYGGQPIERQIMALKKGIEVIIGTPGRLLDHLRRKTIKLENIKCVILDEADEMLNMGFLEDIESILAKTPDTRQTLMFSATMPREIINLSNKFLKEPKLIKVVHDVLTVPKVEQIYYEVKQAFKLELLTRLIDTGDYKLSMIFANTKRGVDELVEKLQARGYQADGLHGDLRQTQRDKVMKDFKTGAFDILVATDVAARGIDIGNVECVYNYDVPQDEEYYVHRIGRTGRAGRVGRAVSFITGKEIRKLKDIERYIKVKIEREEIPSLSEVEDKRLGDFMEKIKGIIDNKEFAPYIPMVENMVDQDYSPLDIAASLMKLAYTLPSKIDSDEEDNDVSDEQMVRLFINAGRKQKIQVKDIVGTIATVTGLTGNLIGVVDIYENYTFVEVPKEYARDVLKSLKGQNIKGNRINVEKASKKQS